ncbi:MAG TPA: hypothetical protein V6D14_15435 [Coleofasciculaceae cyanobacterium]
MLLQQRPQQQMLRRETICLTSTTAIETYLTTFIRWALRVTSNGECVGEMAVTLLEQAWEAQKLLWQLREKKNETLENDLWKQ